MLTPPEARFGKAIKSAIECFRSPHPLRHLQGHRGAWRGWHHPAHGIELLGDTRTCVGARLGMCARSLWWRCHPADSRPPQGAGGHRLRARRDGELPRLQGRQGPTGRPPRAAMEPRKRPARPRPPHRPRARPLLPAHRLLQKLPGADHCRLTKSGSSPLVAAQQSVERLVPPALAVRKKSSQTCSLSASEGLRKRRSTHTSTPSPSP